MGFKEDINSPEARIKSILKNYPYIERIEIDSDDGRKDRIEGNVFRISVPKDKYEEAVKLAEEANEELKGKSKKAKLYKFLEQFEEVIDASEKGEQTVSDEYLNDLAREYERITGEKKQSRKIINKPKTLKQRLINKGQKIKTKIKANIKKIIATGLATLAIAGAVAVANEYKSIEEPQSTISEEQIKDEPTIKNEIDTIDEVVQDFVQEYLEAYNSKYGTKYTSADLVTTRLSGIYIYQLEDGRKVTRGNLPYETKSALSKIGEYESIEMHSDVVQIIENNGRILGTYNISTGEFIYSGNQTEDLTNEKFEEPTLESLGIDPDKLNVAAKIDLARGVEDENSIDSRISKYNSLDEKQR